VLGVLAGVHEESQSDQLHARSQVLCVRECVSVGRGDQLLDIMYQGALRYTRYV
jgi:hypothetical protein